MCAMGEWICNGVEGFRGGCWAIPEENNHQNCGTSGVEEYHTHVIIKK